MENCDKTKKILFVMPKFAPGGAEKSLLMLLHSLAEYESLQVDLLLFKKEGLFLSQIPKTVRIITPEESLRICYSKFSINNMKTLKGGIASFLRIGATGITSVFAKNDHHKTQIRWKYAYKKVIQNCPGEYDVACGYLDGEPVYYVVDKVNAKKKIGWNQNDYNGLGFDPAIDKEYYDKLDAIVTLTPECKEILKKSFPQFAYKMHQIPPIVTKGYIENCAEEYKPKEYENYDGYKLISVGRLVKQKGFDYAIEASAILRDKGLDFRWYIIGNGELFDDLTAQIKERNLENNVFLLGENGNPYPYIKNADLFVQPSRFEGKSVILNEAKMLCIPILVTNYASAVDQINSRENGVIVDMNAESLADGILVTLSDKELLKHLTETLNNTNFDDKAIKEKYIELFGLSKE